jgi:hypothetical protein
VDTEHTLEFRRCLIDMDVPGMRKLWQLVSPHLPQPATDEECIETMHRARARMHTLPNNLKAYSEAWLIERGAPRDVFAVGISVKAASSPDPRKRRRGIYVQHEMSYAAEQSLMWGIGLDNPKDAAEVKRRIMEARDRVG